MRKQLMTRLFLLGSMVVVGAQSVSAAVDAGPRNRIVAVKEAKLGREVGEVRINGLTVFRFRGVKGGDPYTRAQIVAGRLNADDMANLQPREVRVARINGYWAVVARGRLLITADAWTARINRTYPRRLALQWAALVRRQLAPAADAVADPNAG